MTGEAKMNTGINSKDPLKASFDMNSFTQSVRYSLEQDVFGLNASFVRIQGNTKAIIPEQPLLQPYNNNSWDAALDTHYGPWHVGVEYIYNGKSGTLRNNLPAITPVLLSDSGKSEILPTLMYNSQAVGRSYTLSTGIGYIVPNRWGVCLGYLRNSTHTGFMQPDASGAPIKAKGNAWVLSLDRSLLDGVEYFVEVAISYKMSNPAWPYIGTAGAALTQMQYTTSPSNSAAGVLSGLKIKF
jgi:predicted porin